MALGARSQELVCVDDAAEGQIAPTSLHFGLPRRPDSSYAAQEQTGSGPRTARRADMS